MITSALLFVAALATAQTAAPAPDWLRARAHVVAGDAGTVQVGEPFTFVIEAEHTPGGVALLPEELPLDGRFAERKAQRKHLRSGAGDVERDRYELELIAFESGDLTLPPIPLAYGSTRTATPRLELTVATGFTDDELPVASSTRAEAMEELDKMAAADPPPQLVFVDDYTLLYAAGALTGLAIAGFFAWRAWQARKRGRADAEAAYVPPPRPAHELAAEALARLRKAGLLERGELKTFFAEVSEILRAYVGGRYGFDSLDLTVDELMLALSRVSTPGLDVATLRRVLDAADLVKFAKFTPDLTQATSALAAAEDIVERTKPVAPPPEGATNAGRTS